MSELRLLETTEELLHLVDCGHCETQTASANLQCCLLCEFENACSHCIEVHRLQHTPAEFERVRIEIGAALTPREQFNEELKAQVRAQAETICNLIDNTERLLKIKEQQNHQMAQALDQTMTIQ